MRQRAHLDRTKSRTQAKRRVSARHRLCQGSERRSPPAANPLPSDGGRSEGDPEDTTVPSTQGREERFLEPRTLAARVADGAPGRATGRLERRRHLRAPPLERGGPVPRTGDVRSASRGRVRAASGWPMRSSGTGTPTAARLGPDGRGSWDRAAAARRVSVRDVSASVLRHGLVRRPREPMDRPTSALQLKRDAPEVGDCEGRSWSSDGPATCARWATARAGVRQRTSPSRAAATRRSWRSPAGTGDRSTVVRIRRPGLADGTTAAVRHESGRTADGHDAGVRPGRRRHAARRRPPSPGGEGRCSSSGDGTRAAVRAIGGGRRPPADRTLADPPGPLRTRGASCSSVCPLGPLDCTSWTWRRDPSRPARSTSDGAAAIGSPHDGAASYLGVPVASSPRDRGWDERSARPWRSSRRERRGWSRLRHRCTMAPGRRSSSVARGRHPVHGRGPGAGLARRAVGRIEGVERAGDADQSCGQRHRQDHGPAGRIRDERSSARRSPSLDASKPSVVRTRSHDATAAIAIRDDEAVVDADRGPVDDPRHVGDPCWRASEQPIHPTIRNARLGAMPLQSSVVVMSFMRPRPRSRKSGKKPYAPPAMSPVEATRPPRRAGASRYRATAAAVITVPRPSIRERPVDAEVEQAGTERHRRGRGRQRSRRRGTDKVRGDGSTGCRDVVSGTAAGARQPCGSGSPIAPENIAASPSSTPASAPPIERGRIGVRFCRRCSKSVSTTTIAAEVRNAVTGSAG